MGLGLPVGRVKDGNVILEGPRAGEVGAEGGRKKVKEIRVANDGVDAHRAIQLGMSGSPQAADIIGVLNLPREDRSVETRCESLLLDRVLPVAG